MELLTRESSAPITGHDTAASRVTVQLFRYNDPRPVRDADGIEYREAYAVDSLELADDMSVSVRHHGDLIGRIDPETYDPTGDGPTVDLVLSRSAAGVDTLADVEAGVLRAVSVEIEPLEAFDRDGVVIRTRSVLHGVAFAFRPAHDAPVLATRETLNNGGTMTTNPAPTAPAPATDPAPAGHVTGVTVEVLNRSMEELRDDLTRVFASERTPSDGDAVSVFRSLGEYAEAVWSDPANPILRRALADQLPSANPGVIPAGWLSDIKGIVDAGAPLIGAFGREGLPAEGMDINWPVFTGDIKTLVAEQVTPKTSIQSVTVDIDKGTENIATFAGGSDIAYQLIRRSSPAYLSAYLRLMSMGYTACTEAAASVSAMAVAVPSGATWDPTTGDLEGLADALFTASVEVQTATGAPAQFALADSATFIAAGGKATANVINPTSDPGTASAATLSVTVGGLRIVHAPYLTTGKLLVSNGVAAKWHGDGPFTASAEDVERLGQNVAVWGMGAFGAYVPNGIRSIASV